MSESIQALYRDVLGRDADDAGLATWTNALNNGTSYSDIRSQFAHSDEARQKIDVLYEQVLGREADESGLEGKETELTNGLSLVQVRHEMAYSNEATAEIDQTYEYFLQRSAYDDPVGLAGKEAELDAGETIDQVRNEVAGSPEGYSKSAGAAAALEDVYQQVLGRASDPSGLAYLKSELANGVSLIQIRQGLASSDEAAAHIQVAFQSILARDASPTDISYWEGRLGDASFTLAGMIQQLIISPEAYSKSAGAAAALEDVYQQVLGRASDPSSLAYRKSELANGVSLAQIRQETATSGEAAAHIQVAFQSILARDASPTDISYWEGHLGNASFTLAGMIQQLIISPEAYSKSVGAASALEDIYQQVLGRASDPSSLAYLKSELANGVSLVQIRQGVATSGEAAAHIQAAFQSILARDASPTDISYWEGRLGNGSVTLAGLIQQLIISPEAYSNSADATAALEDVYQQVLGRASDPSSLAYLQSELANGVSLAQIRQGVATSDEAAAHIQGAFQSILGRDASPTDISYWEGHLGDASFSLAGLIQQLIISPEAYSKSAGAAAALEDIYQQVLGRASDPSSLAYRKSELANGVSLAQIRQETATSGEAAAHIQAAFQSILARDATPTDISYWEGRLGNGSVTLAGLIQQLIISPEAYSKSVGAAAALEDISQQVLGRASDPSSLAYLKSELANGVSLVQIRQETATSGEAAAHIQAAFQSILARDASPTDISYWEGHLGDASFSLAGLIQQLIISPAYSKSAGAAAALEGIYQQVLGRASDPSSLAYKESELANGVSLAQIRQETATSNESASHIQAAFQTIIGDDASPTDIAYWESHLGDGSVTLASMQQQFIAAEAYAQSPAVVAAINDQYQQVLGRDADPIGLTHTQIEVARGATFDQIRSELASSPEATSAIKLIFQSYVARDATADELQQLQTFVAGGGTLANVPLQIHALAQLGSGLLSEEAELDELYREILGHPGDPAGLAGKEAEIAAGSSWSNIRHEIAYGAEATQDIETLYQQILGRTVTQDELDSKQADLASGSTLDRTRSEIQQLPEAVLRKGVNSGLVLEFTEDAYLGDAQFTISVDGVQAGGVYTSGSPFNGVNQIQAVVPDALLSAGPHTVQMTFLNDAFGSLPGQDRNLYLLGAYLGGQPIAGASGVMGITGSSISFGVTVDEAAANSQQDAAIANLYTEVTGAQIDQTTTYAAEDAIDAGSTIGDVRDVFAHSSASGQAIDNIYREVLNRGATSAEISVEEASLSAGDTLSSFRRNLAVSGEVTAELGGIYHDVLNVSIDDVFLAQLEAQIANGRSLTDVRPSLAFSDETRGTINQLYVDQVGRPATGDEIVYWQARLANGQTLGNITDKPNTSVAGTLAYYGLTTDEPPDYVYHKNVDLYENLSADPAFDRANGNAPDIGPLTLVGSDGKTMASTDARSLLALLPVYVTMNGGQSPNLVLANGQIVTFNDTVVHGNVYDMGSNAEELAGYLYRTAQHANSNDPLLANAYGQTMAWLNQVDQPALQAAVYYAVMSRGYTASGDSDRALESQTASALALQIASQDPSSRSMSLTSQIEAFGKLTQITVTSGGDATFHDIDNSIIFQIIETVVTVVADILAITQPEIGIPLAIAVHTAEAGQAFSDGNIIGGVLNLAAAAGAGFAYLGNTLAAEIIITASQAIGAGSQIIQGAENGDIASIIGGIISAAGAVASGLDAAAISNGTAPAATSLFSLQSTLAAAGSLTSFGAAVSRGDIEGGLLNSLGPWLAALAAQSFTDGSVRADQIAGIPIDAVEPQYIQPLDVQGKIVVFVGGFTDQFIGGDSLIHGAYKGYVNRGNAAEYFSWDQGQALDAYVRNQTQPVVIISHSYGADTAATVVANGAKVDTLLTLDPVSQVRPSYDLISQNSGKWIDLNAVGGGASIPNLVAAIGGPWGTSTRGYASTFQNVNLDHGGIGDSNFILRNVLGVR